jgi:hypothetical protein
MHASSGCVTMINIEIVRKSSVVLEFLPASCHKHVYMLIGLLFACAELVNCISLVAVWYLKNM